MYRRNRLLSATVVAITAAALPAIAGAAAFSSTNDIVVATLNGDTTVAAPTVTLNEYSTANSTSGGSAINSVNFASTGSNALRGYGSTSARDGTLTQSSDGSQLVYAGYRQDTSTASVFNAATPRVIGVVTANGTADASRVAITGSVSAFRSAASADGSNYYFAQDGTSESIGLYKSDGSTTPISVDGSSFRSVFTTPTELFASTGSTNPITGKGVSRFGNLPTGTTATPAPIISDSTASIIALDLNSTVAGVDTIYAVGSAGALKYSLVGGNWVANGSQLAPPSGQLFGVAAKVNTSGSVDLYYSSNTSVYRFIDGGYNTAFGSGVSTFPTAYLTAAAGTQFRGIAFAVPEPASLSLAAISGLGLLRRRQRAR